MAIVDIPISVAVCPLGGPLIFDTESRRFYDEDGGPVSSLSLAQLQSLSSATAYVKEHWPLSKENSGNH